MRENKKAISVFVIMNKSNERNNAPVESHFPSRYTHFPSCERLRNRTGRQNHYKHNVV